MKRSLIFTLILALVMVMVPAAAFGQDAVNVTVDSVPVGFTTETGAPFVDAQGRTQVPFRVSLEAFGAEVQWDAENSTAVATKGDVTVKVPVGKDYILKNDEEIKIDSAALVKDNRTYLPIRPVMEAFGASVEWDKYGKTVVITTENVNAEEILNAAIAKSADWESYGSDMTVNMTMVGPDETGKLITVVIDSKGSVEVMTNPVTLKMVMSMDAAADGETMSVPMEMYVETTDKGIVEYLNSNGQWLKIDIEDNGLAAIANMDAKANMEVMKDFLKDVKYLGKYTVDGKELIKVSVSLDAEGYQKLMGQYLNTLGQDMAATMDSVIKNMDGFEYVMWIDAASNEICSYEMDLTDLMDSMLPDLVGSMGISEEKAASLEGMEMTMKMFMSVKDVNSIEKIEIPQEVKDSAITMEEFLKQTNSSSEDTAQ